MAYVTTHPVIIDGIRLDTLAWGIETMTFTTGGLRAGDLTLPGLHGVIPTLNDSRDAAMVSLGLVVKGADADGLVPANSDAIQELRRNLDTLLALFGTTHRLIDVREVIDPAAVGTTGQRQAWGKVIDAMAPDIALGQSARMNVNISIPSGYWQDVDSLDWSQVVTPNTVYTVPSLNRSSAPILDAIFTLTGPINQPSIVDVATGHKVTLPGLLAAGQTWRVNSATWETRTGSTLTLASADTAGASRAADTATVGAGPYLAPLTPELIAGIPQVRVKVEGTGTTTATTLKTRTRRTYL